MATAGCENGSANQDEPAAAETNPRFLSSEIEDSGRLVVRRERATERQLLTSVRPITLFYLLEIRHRKYRGGQEISLPLHLGTGAEPFRRQLLHQASCRRNNKGRAVGGGATKRCGASPFLRSSAGRARSRRDLAVEPRNTVGCRRAEP